MYRTALLCAVLALGGYAAADWLTQGFQVWTAEGARRVLVETKPVPAPEVQVEGPGIGRQPLSQVLAGGGVTVVDFFYTRCQTICLALGSAFQQMQARQRQAAQSDPNAAQVKLLSISFDERDGIAELHAYATRVNADFGHWRFVRVADAEQLRRLLADFQVVVVPDGRGDFEHNAALLVVDGGGRLVRIFDYAEHQMALDYARHLAAGGAP